MLRPSVEPRLYQETIFATASLKNTLVVLPTGMGKTLIAELLTVHRLEHYTGSKVLILAPTRPLVQQHKTTFRKDLALSEEEAVMFTGNVSPAKRAALWKNAKIIFSTPQGLENDLVGSKISLKDVSLLVFDEAHRATGDYSYVFIADRYKKEATHERILALTASPGSDKESIEQVCKVLHIEEIESRSAESSDVKPYIQDIDVEYLTVPMPAEFKGAHAAFQRCLKRRLDDVVELGVVNRQALHNKTLLLKAQAGLYARSAKGEKSYEALKTMSLLAEALKLQHGIELLETQGVASLEKYLGKLRAEATAKQSKAVQNLVADVDFKAGAALVASLKEANVEHPKLKALQKAVLRTLYADKNAKIIIFNQYRDQAVRIKQALDEINVSANIFVGQLKKGETGMTQLEQHRILESFRAGEFSCLIATSVAEEGLDIPKVDVVLFYEPVPSAIRTVQRRGRTGRLEKGKIIMLITEGTRDVAHKWAAHHKEKRMYRVLSEVKGTLSGEGEEVEAQTTLNENNEENADVIIADHREKTSGVLKELIDMNVKIDLRQLDVGDYRLSDRVVVEYKRVPDFVNSIVDGRLLQQLRGLRSYPRPLIIIEGDEDIYSVRNVHQNAILGMLAAITVSYNIPVLFTKTPKETASLLALIARKERERGSAEPSAHTQKPLTETERQEFIISSLPGVGPSLAKALLKEFGSVKGVVDASPESLQRVDKVGEKKAKAIHDAVRKKYEPNA